MNDAPVILHKNNLDIELYEDFPDYMLAYQSYQRSKNEYLVSQGLAPEKVLAKSFLEKFAAKADVIVTGYGRIRRQANLKTRILM